MLMKTFGIQVLILGGLYFIISNLLSLGTGVAFEVCNVAALSIFTLLLAFLCFKKKYVFLSRLQDKFKKTSVYIAALGVAQYFGVVFAGIPAMVYGYQNSVAQYNGSEPPAVPFAYLQAVSFAYWAVLFFSLLIASYYNFRRK